MKQRNRYLLVSLGGLVILSLSLLFLSMKEVRPEINRDLFKVGGTEKINEVTLQSSRETVVLKFENNRWSVNEKWEADAQMIKVLFATILQAEPRRPVAASMKDSLGQWLVQNGTKVTLSEAGLPQTVFFAGGNELKTETWFLKEGETQPYVMAIPGYRVYVAGILELTESGWRNKRIFNFNWRNFKLLTASYPKEPNQGFEIEMKDHYPSMRNMTAVDTAKLNTYLDDISLLFAARYVTSGQPSIDSVLATGPAARIEISDIAGHNFVLEIFSPRKTDDEVFGRTSDGQVVTLSKNDVSKIVKKRIYFNSP